MTIKTDVFDHERDVSLLTILWNLSQYPAEPDQSGPADRAQTRVYGLITKAEQKNFYCNFLTCASFIPSQSLCALWYGTSDCSLLKHLTSESWLPQAEQKTQTWEWRYVSLTWNDSQYYNCILGRPFRNSHFSSKMGSTVFLFTVVRLRFFHFWSGSK